MNRIPGVPYQLQRYGVAILAVAQAVLLTLLIDPQLKQQISPLLFVVAVMVSAGYGGLGPGLLATGLTTLTTAYILITPTFTLVSSWDKPLWLIAFGLVTLLVSVLAAAHRQAEERLEARVRQQVAVAELGQQALSSSDLSKLMDNTVSLVAQTLEIEYCKILELLPDGETLLLRAGVGWHAGLVGQMTAEAKTGSHAGYTLLSNEPVLIEDWRTEKRFNLPPHHDHQITSGISVIINGHNSVFGVLGAYATKRRAFTQDQVYFLQAIANILAEVIDRQEREEALRKSEERYRAFVEQSSEGIWRFELEEPLSVDHSEEEQIQYFYQYGYLAECNNAMAQMYGFSCAAELVGTKLDDLLVRSDPQNHAYLLSFIRSGYRLTETESHEVDRQGQPKYFLNNLVGMIENGTLVRAWGSQRNITARKQLEKALRQQAAELAQANRMKDEFLAIVSHELRSPLNAILGWAGLLRTRKYDETTTARALETIERNAKSQTQLIDDLLDVSRIIRGKLRLNSRSINLTTVIEAAIDTVRPAAEAKGINFQFLASSELVKPILGFGLKDTGQDQESVELNKNHFQLDNSKSKFLANDRKYATQNPKFCVLGDADRLQQVVWNLLSNAIKFTPEGGQVEVQLGCINSHIQLRVSDTGQGISADLLPHIFERFRQADSTSTRSHGGLGLGLAIVRQLVELHGGTVEAESSGVGKGATFTVTLPSKADHDGIASGINSANGLEQPGLMLETRTDDSFAPLAGLQILVVDDEAEMRTLSKLVLEQYGSRVTVAASVGEALAVLEYLQPHVLLCDIGLPGENGYALIRKVRELESQGRQIPAAAITAFARPEDRVRALSSGFQAYLPKPVEPTKLVMTVADLAGRIAKDSSGFKETE